MTDTELLQTAVDYMRQMSDWDLLWRGFGLGFVTVFGWGVVRWIMEIFEEAE